MRAFLGKSAGVWFYPGAKKTANESAHKAAINKSSSGTWG